MNCKQCHLFLLVLCTFFYKAIVLIFTVSVVDEEEDFPEDALSNHIDMVDNEPAENEARRQFMR